MKTAPTVTQPHSCDAAAAARRAPVERKVIGQPFLGASLSVSLTTPGTATSPQALGFVAKLGVRGLGVARRSPVFYTFRQYILIRGLSPNPRREIHCPLGCSQGVYLAQKNALRSVLHFDLAEVRCDWNPTMS